MHDIRRRPDLSEHAPDPGRSGRQRSRRGLDWFVFFVADVQAGFGPFIAVYLTSQKWTQIDIGVVLTVGGLISLFGQIPGGALLDRLQSPRRVAAIAISIIALSALILALWPTYPGVMASRILQAGASCVLGPAIAAMSLGLVPRNRIGDRFGRNAAFASVGAGLAAAAMGATRILHFEPGGVLRHGRARRAGAARALPDQAERTSMSRGRTAALPPSLAASPMC